MPRIAPTDKQMVKCIFWCHFAVGVLSHFAVFFLLAGAINLLWTSDQVGFWTRGMLYGLTFFASMYGVNHVGNDVGFCALTDIENFYRKRVGMATIGRFMPRFYAKLRELLRLKKAK